MKIEINSGGLQGNAIIDEMKADVSRILTNSLRLDSALSRIKAYAAYTNGTAQNVSEAIGLIEQREREEQKRAENIRDASRQVETFINNTRNVDKAVAQTIDMSYNNQNNSGSSGKSGGGQNSNIKGDQIVELYREVCRIVDEENWLWDAMRLAAAKEIKKQIEELIAKREIQLTEEQNKEIEKIRNDIFFDDKVSETDKKNIEERIMNMPEPFKSLYYKYFEKTNLGNMNADRGKYTSFIFNSVDVDMANSANREGERYATFFHEMGHSIDHNSDGWSNYSLTYRDSQGRSLMDVLYKDALKYVEKYVKNSNYINNSDFSEESLNRIVAYFLGHRMISFDSLSEDEQRAVESIQRQYYSEHMGETNSTVSDIIGGVTNNLLIGSSGHVKHDSKWTGDNSNIIDYTSAGWGLLNESQYWYNSMGVPTGNQAMELFAEYFSFNCIGSEGEDNLASIREAFGESAKFMDEMVKSMIEK